MRRLAIILLGVFACVGLRAQSSDTLWERANAAYINGSYGEAIALYDSILGMERSSAKLYYNLAGAHFKSGHIARAKLNYRRAERLAPWDADIAHNIEVVDALVKDRIEPLPEFFLGRWARTLRSSLSSNAWAWTALALLALAGSAVLVFLLSIRLGWRKAGFWMAIACGILLVVALDFAWVTRREAVRPTSGVVMRMNVSIRSSPDAHAKELYIVNEGTEVRVTGELQQWLEVTLADGKKGWIEMSSIELI